MPSANNFARNGESGVLKIELRDLILEVDTTGLYVEDKLNHRSCFIDETDDKPNLSTITLISEEKEEIRREIDQWKTELLLLLKKLSPILERLLEMTSRSSS